MATNPEELTIGSANYEAYSISTGLANLLMIKGNKGFLGCGYFNIDVAQKLGEAVALVTGVDDYADMLNAKIFALSPEAENLGIKMGMSGQEALEHFGSVS